MVLKAAGTTSSLSFPEVLLLLFFPRYCIIQTTTVTIDYLKHICDDIMMDFDALAAAPSGLGTAALIVMSKSASNILA